VRRVRDVSFAPWIGVAYEAAWLMLESQWVVAARMARLAAGGALAQTEAQRMISEKSAAFVESTTMAAGALAGGKKGPIAKRDATPVKKFRSAPSAASPALSSLTQALSRPARESWAPTARGGQWHAMTVRNVLPLNFPRA
jgi:hypothetical protein